MTAHSPDDRLSAFYDGELSAAERAEVERLVAAQPGLRAELNTLTGLSQRLSDLADDLPEVDLRPRVMQRIAASRPAAVSSDAPTRRRWMPLALLVCSLTLLFAAVLPLLPLSNNTELVVDNGPRVLTLDELAQSMKDASATPGANADIPGESFASHDSPAMATLSSPEEAGLGGARGALSDRSENVDGTGPSELLARIERRRDLKPGDIVSQMIEGGDVPMIADYTVIDVRRSARDVEFLLQKHSIVPLLASDRRKTSESTGGSERQATTPAPSEIIKVYLVDAETASLNTAMFECERLQEVVALNYLPLGLDEAGGAQLASQNGPAMQSADPSPVVAGSPPPAPAAMPRAVAQPGLRGAGEVVAKDTLIARQSMASGQPFPQDKRDQTDTKQDDVARVKGKVASDVNGNSIVIENGDEFYSEVMQRQVQSLKNADRGYPVKQQQNIDVPAITGRNTSAAQSLEALSNRNTAPQFDGRRGGNGVLSNNAYSNNAYNGGRSRQRAILVLRSQSPPPPPEATRLNP